MRHAPLVFLLCAFLFCMNLISYDLLGKVVPGIPGEMPDGKVFVK